jgi:hypothetical protein
MNWSLPRRTHRLARGRLARPSRPLTSRLVIVLGLGALVAAPLLPMQPAGAQGCADGWTAVGDSECELRVTGSGDVTMPNGVGKIDVMVVGGGGGGGGGTVLPGDPYCRFQFPFNCLGSNFSWAGGGGSGGQTVCTGMDLTGTVTVTVGEGGLGAVSATYPDVTPAAGGDGASSTVDTCTASGGKGGGSSVSVGGSANDGYAGQTNGAGGASGNGVAGVAAPVSTTSNDGNVASGGGAGASNAATAQEGFIAEGTRGGGPTRPTGGCFTGTVESFASGGGAGTYTRNAQSFIWNPANGGFLDQYRSGSVLAGGIWSEREPAVDGPINSGNGGGGGQQMAGHIYSDSTVYEPAAYDGAEGGSGLVILRYSTADEPTITSFSFPFAPPEGGSTLTITGTGFSCGPEVTIGGTPCSFLEVVSATEMRCTTPAGTGLVDIVVTTGAGSVTSADGFCYGAPGSPACEKSDGGDGGGGGGDDGTGADTGAGSEAGDAEFASTGAGRTSLPATGFDSLLALAGTASVVLGSTAMALGARRRSATD